MKLCLHQTTSSDAGYRRSLEGYAKAGIKYVEIIPPQLEEYAKKEGLPAAKRLLFDLGLTAVSSGGVRGLAEPGPNRAKAIEDLKAKVAMIAELGIDRIVCPCGPSEKFVMDEYKRAEDNLREVGEIVKPYRIVAMLEFMRGSTLVETKCGAARCSRDILPLREARPERLYFQRSHSRPLCKVQLSVVESKCPIAFVWQRCAWGQAANHTQACGDWLVELKVQPRKP